MKSSCIAHPNMALVKYWGKRDGALRLPAAGSLSLTLGGLWTEATVEFLGPGVEGSLEIDGRAALPAESRRVLDFVARAVDGTGRPGGARVATRSNIPRSAGLASSAAAFAALAGATSRAAGLSLDGPALSRLARAGSGSACRSVFGGFAEWLRGERSDGLDSHAVQTAGPDHWDLRMLFLLFERREKEVGSTEGMERSRRSSPFYEAWVAGNPADLEAARRAILERDLATLGETAEHNGLKMHAVMAATRPALIYWAGRTIEAIQAARAARREGLMVFTTVDAGPNPAWFCEARDLPAAADLAGRLFPGVEQVACGPGEGVRPCGELF